MGKDTQGVNYGILSKGKKSGTPPMLMWENNMRRY